MNRRFKINLLQFVFLTFVLTLIFCLAYKLTSFKSWSIPLGYGGDLWFGMSIIQAYMLNEIPLFGFKYLSYLNAPDFANWNDYPITEDLIFYLTGNLAKFIGLYPATNFLLLLSHLLAGLSMWFVCKFYRFNLSLSFAGAIAFAFSHFIFARGLGHIVVGFCWHIPLLLMLLQRLFSKSTFSFNSKKFIFAAFISFLAGMLNPYYSIMYCQLLLFSSLYFYLNNKKDKVFVSLALITIVILAFFLVNSESIIYGLINGVNKNFSGRNLAALELYALKIPDMFFSPGVGTLFNTISHDYYFSRVFVKGEFWSPYLGFFGIGALVLFYFINTKNFISKKIDQVSIHYWYSIWIILFSIVGGINLLFGVAGFTFLRATNRLSIFIFVIVVLFFIQYCSKRFSNKFNFVISLFIIYSVWYEQLGPRILSPENINNPIEKIIDSDKKFINDIESKVPGGKVFQLPVMKFPEVGPIHNMGDYEHFRMSLNSTNLHFTYGTNKGRGDTDWQYNIEEKSPEQIVNSLESYGFSIIAINKKGYEDEASWLIAKLSQYSTLISETDDLVAFRLNPTESQNDLIVSFPEGWSDDEITHRWSLKSKANIVIRNFNKKERITNISFKITSLQKNYIEIFLNDNKLKSIDLPLGKKEEVIFKDLVLNPGKNIIKFKSQRWPKKPGNGDNRKLTFAISDFIIENK